MRCDRCRNLEQTLLRSADASRAMDIRLLLIALLWNLEKRKKNIDKVLSSLQNGCLDNEKRIRTSGTNRQLALWDSGNTLKVVVAGFAEVRSSEAEEDCH